MTHVADPNEELVLPFLSAGKRTIQVVALGLALAMAASVTMRPEKGLVWLSTSFSSPAGGGPGASAEAKVDPGLDRAAPRPVSVVVQAAPGAEGTAEAAVRAAGGQVGAPLPVVNGFEASISGDSLVVVAASGAVRAVTGNRTGRFSQQSADENLASSFPTSSGATSAWRQGDRGEGVGVAVIDTGVSPVGDLAPRVVYGPDLSGEGSLVDTYGHGTVMAGLIAGSGADSATDKKGSHPGMAPNAHLIAVKAAGADGVTNVSTILQAMHWVSAYRTSFDIRVLNLAWGTASTQSPALDPLNVAVERLWHEGIVVVVAAGNSGPGPSTVTKPGDDPLVITVGAYDDKGDANPSNDRVPDWSSRGPTAGGLRKPDLVAPGRTLVSTRSFGSTVEAENPKALVGSSYIKGSGTSQAAAVTSGAAALVLAAHPTYTPDQVKAVLTGSASPLAGAGPNEAGAGRLQLTAALAANPGPSLWQVPAVSGDLGPAADRNVWTGGSWTGGLWTGGSWTGGSWTGGSWTGGSWTGGSWTGGSWTSAFWGDHPGAGAHVPGEASA